MANLHMGKDGLVKARVTAIVEQYIKDFPEEFDVVKKGVEMTRKMTANQFATLDGSKDSRALYEISETLSTAFIMGLSEEEMMWFKTKEGAHWFTRTFHVFALPSSI